VNRNLAVMSPRHWIGRHRGNTPSVSDMAVRTSGGHSNLNLTQFPRFVLIVICLAVFLVRASGQGPVVSHTIQISNTADDGYYNEQDGSGWNAIPQFGGADLVGSSAGITAAWVNGYRFPSTGINPGETIRSAYLQLVSSDSFASSATCGSPPCANTNYTFRIYGVAQGDGPPFSNAAGNTPLDVPYTTAYVDYTTTGPGDVHGSCHGNNNGQNTCTHVIDVTGIVQQIISQSGWTSTSAMRFVMLSTTSSTSNVYAGYEDYSANPAKAATLLVNPPLPAIVSSGAWGTSPTTTYPASYPIGPFVYPGASTLLLFLGDYYNYNDAAVSQPTVSDSCGNTWNILAGPTDWPGLSYDHRSTVYYVQNPASCPSGDTITITPGATPDGEPIFLHFLAVAGSNTAQNPVASAITNPPDGTNTLSATTNSITLNSVGELVSWIFGDSDVSTTFTPKAGFITDVNSTPTYLTAAGENVSSPGSYQNEFMISPSDGWQTILIGLPATTGTTATPTVTLTPSPTSIGPTQDLTVAVTVSGTPTPTGSVTLAGGGYNSGAAILSGGVATVNIPAGSLSDGTDALTASYTPDSNSSSTYSGATGTTSVIVAEFTPTVMVTPSASSISTTQALSVTVAISGGTSNPTATGSVTLSGGGYTSSATSLSGGSATINIAAGVLAIGSDTLTVSYTPDSNSSSTYTSATGTTSVLVANPGVIISPGPGSTLTSASTTFTWSAGTGGVTGYFLHVGTMPGAADLVNMGVGTSTSATVTLPTNGATIYVQLETHFGGAVFENNNTYTEYTKVAPTVTVTPLSSSITTTQALSVTVTVAAGMGSPTPTGSVTLSGGGFTSGAAALTAGTATINIPSGTLGPASYTFIANYTPDSNGSLLYNSASGTAPSSVSVNVTTPTVALTPGASSITTTQPLSVTVTVSGGTGNATPTGTVTLSGGSYTSAATTLISGTATINIPTDTLSAGGYNFKASYTPDSTSSSIYGSASGTASSGVTVTLTAPTVTVTPGVSSINATQALSVTVTVSGGTGNPAPTGSVTLSGGSYTSAAATLTSDTVTINIPANTLTAGSYSFKASYAPDSTSSSIYNIASGTATSAVTVSVTPSVTVTPGASSITTTQPLSVTVTVSSGTGNPAPTGTVTLSGGSYVSAATTLSGGIATINLPASTLSAGNYTFKASYAPDSTSSSIFNSASGTAASAVTVGVTTPMVTVTPGASTITTTQPLSVTVTLNGGTGSPTATGSVTLSSGSYTSTPTTLSGGMATITIPANTLPAGSYTFKASYTPDATSSSIYASALGTASSTVTVIVTTPTVTVAPSASSITITQALSVTVTVSGGTGNPAPTGTVTLSGGSYTSAATTLSGGTAAINIPAGTLSMGTYTFKASYTPDPTSSPIYASASGTASSAVGVGLTTPTVGVTPSMSSITTTQALSVTVTLNGGTSNPTPTGTVTLSGGSYTSAATTLSGGIATINIPADKLSAGSYTFKASYASDATSSSIYGSASGTASSAVTVSLTTPTVTVTPGVSSITITQPLSVTVTVGGGTGNPMPTGTVTLSGGSYTSAATTLSGGTATISITGGTLSAGSYTFTASYAPDATSSPIYGSASGTASSAVNATAPTFTMSATSVTVAPGGSISSTVTATSSNGYAGTITLTCSVTAEPTGATDIPTCIGGQVTLNSSTTSGTVGVSVSSTAASASLMRPRPATGSGWAGPGEAVLAVLVFLWVPGKQRKWRALLGVVFGLILLGNLVACGGGGGGSTQTSNPGTTAGSYTITVSGTGNDTAKTNASTTFTLTVN